MNDRLEGFDSIFYPKSHAVIGASADLSKFGGRYLRVLLGFGYPGKVFPVNPKESEILELKAYPSVTDIPEEVDFATISVPAPAVPQVVEECLAKGVKAAQILTSGFGEMSVEGERLERAISSTAARGIRIVGPNCFGVYCPGGGVTILPGGDLPKESGPVAFISQSGGYGIRVPRRAYGWGIRFSKVISYGNACDVNECDLLEYLGQDEETRIITAYLEGVKDGPRFVRLLKEVSKIKPVILFKGGLTQSGAIAVNSHTGSLGGQEEVWDAVFKQTNAIRANNLEELLDTMLAFMHLAPKPERKICAMGGGGAITVTAADICDRLGVSLPLFSKEMQKKLLPNIPAVGASARNPVDMGSPGPPPNMVRAVMETVLGDGVVNTIIIDEIESAASNPEGPMAKLIIETKERFGTPIIIVLPVEAIALEFLEREGNRRKSRDYYLSEGIPVFLTLDRAIRALANLDNYYRHRETFLSSA